MEATTLAFDCARDDDEDGEDDDDDRGGKAWAKGASVTEKETMLSPQQGKTVTMEVRGDVNTGASEVSGEDNQVPCLAPIYIHYY